MMPNKDDDRDDVRQRSLDDRDEGWPNARELIRRPRGDNGIGAPDGIAEMTPRLDFSMESKM